MKLSPILGIRRRVGALTELARRDSARSWSRKTAAVIDLCLRNEAPLSTDAVRKFALIPPNLQDVAPLLPRLEKWGLSQRADGAMDVVGDLALQLQLVPNLSQRFQAAWIAGLQTKNPFKAIQAWKQTGLPVELGIQLYLAARQTSKAAELAAQLPTVPGSTMRKLISQLKDPAEVQRWVNRWQAMSPEDARWLQHSVGTRGIDVDLPANVDRTVFPTHRPQVKEQLQHLVTHVNTVLRNSPDLLVGVHSEWQTAMSSPSRDTLQQLISAIAHQAPQLNGEAWLPILRFVDTELALLILQKLPPSPREFATVISRAQTTEQIERVLTIISPDVMYSRECLGALAHRSPALFLGLAIPPELLETSLDPHHLVSLWLAQPPPPVVAWLYPLTLDMLDSTILLRAAVQCLRSEPEKVHELLTEFVVNRGFLVDRSLLSSTSLKLPAPSKHKLSHAEAQQLVSDVHTLVCQEYA